MNEENLYFQIELTARKIRRFGQNILTEHNINITIEQWLVLKVIYENKGINQIKVGAILVKDKPTISRMIKSLLTKNYIIKENTTDDLREFSLSLTKSGEELVKLLLPTIIDIRKKGLGNLSETEKEVTKTTLLKIRENLEN